MVPVGAANPVTPATTAENVIPPGCPTTPLTGGITPRVATALPRLTLIVVEVALK